MSEEKNLSVEDIQNIENVVGYTFKNKKLLTQAFTRSSYVNEHKGELSNEVLEFYGDRALDLTVTTTLAKMFGFLYDGKYRTSNPLQPNEKIDEGYLSSLRSSIVCKRSLANRIDELDLIKYLRTGKGDLIENIYYTQSVKEDLFEAICGAVAIENEWDYSAYSDVIVKFLNLSAKIKEAVVGSDKSQIFNEWHITKFGVPVEIAFVQELNDRYGASLIIDPQGQCIQIDGYGLTAMEAKNDAIEAAYNMLFVDGKRFEYYPEDIHEVFKEGWLNPTKDNAVNILQEMEQVDIIRNVKYSYEQNENDENGDPLWECTIEYQIDPNPNFHNSVNCRYAKSKSDIKKRGALLVIKDIFEYFHYKKDIIID